MDQFSNNFECCYNCSGHAFASKVNSPTVPADCLLSALEARAVALTELPMMTDGSKKKSKTVPIIERLPHRPGLSPEDAGLALFREWDANDDGSLSHGEIKKAMRKGQTFQAPTPTAPADRVRVSRGSLILWHVSHESDAVV